MKRPQVHDYKALHAEAMQSPAPGFERSFVGLYRSLAEYAAAYSKRFGDPIGDDPVIGEAWKRAIDGIHGLLDCEYGRLDGGEMSRLLHELAESGGSKEGVERARAATRSKPAPEPCSHPSHRNPGLLTPCPECGEQRDPDMPPPGERALTDREILLLAHLEVDEEGRARLDPKQGVIQDWPVLKKVVTTLGGKWLKGTRGKPGYFVFEEVDAEEAIRTTQREGKILDPKTLDLFETPPELAAHLFALLGRVGKRPHVLEPSAGRGALVRAIMEARPEAHVTAHEVFTQHHEAIYRAGKPGHLLILGSDFLERKPGELWFDHVLMNPPFRNRGDVWHIEHAVQFLKPGGTLVAVASAGIKFRMDYVSQGFRELVQHHDGTIDNLPDGSFQDSGTDVRTVVVRLKKRV